MLFSKKTEIIEEKRAYPIENSFKSSNFLKEITKGKVEFTDNIFNSDTWGIKDKELAKRIIPVPYNHELLLQCYKQIPKVFRAINTRAEFAVQSGFRLMGNDADSKKLERWMNKFHFDNSLIQIVKEMLIFGNCFIYPVSSGMGMKLKFLPVTTMRILKEPYGELLGYVQIFGNKVIERWGPEEIIHFKWNSICTESYGVPELNCLVTGSKVLEKKLDNEQLMGEMLKHNKEPIVVMRCGTPEKPYSDSQMARLKTTIEQRTSGGSLLVPGDLEPVVIQANMMAETMNFINHIENQINTGINLPQILIEGRADAQGSLIQMDALERDVKTIQDVLGMGVERNIFTRVTGKDDVPNLVWNPMNIETSLRMSRMLRQLVGDSKSMPVSIITINEARELLGYKEMPKEELDAIKSTFGFQPSAGAGGKEVPLPKVPKADNPKPSPQ